MAVDVSDYADFFSEKRIREQILDAVSWLASVPPRIVNIPFNLKGLFIKIKGKGTDRKCPIITLS